MKKDNRKRGVKQETWFGKGQAHSCGVNITVSHHSDWWLTVLLHFKKLPRRQTSKLNTSMTQHFHSSWLVIVPSHTSATLLPAFQLLYSYQVTSSGGAEMVINSTYGWWCQMLHNGIIIGQTETATRWDPSPCWRWTGLLHLIRGWLEKSG